MPFFCNTRCCGVTRYEVTFNVGEICELIEVITKKTYTGAINKESRFWVYVGKLEGLYSDDFNKFYSKYFKKIEGFHDWFRENYNTIEEWDNIQDNFEDDEEEEEKNIN